VTVLRYADLTVSPWANGGGLTRQLASWPQGSAVADFGWRISVAEVAAAGDFSAFAGVDRVIVLCDGPAMTLRVDGVEHRLARHGPFAFAGDAATTCTLPGGPTRDLNVMTRRGQWQAEVSVLSAATRGPGTPGGPGGPVGPGGPGDPAPGAVDISPGPVSPGTVVFIVALGPLIRVSSSSLGLAVDLTSYDAVRFDPVPEVSARLTLSGDSPVAVIHLTPA
jgi:hypothetical protein